MTLERLAAPLAVEDGEDGFAAVEDKAQACEAIATEGEADSEVCQRRALQMADHDATEKWNPAKIIAC